MTRTILLAAILAATGACARGNEQDIDRSHAADPFLGDVDVRIVLPGASRDRMRESGSGSAQFIDLGDGKARLVVSGSIRGDGDAGFAVDGVGDERGWSSSTDGVSLTVAEDGTISGSATAHPHRLRFGGSVADDEFDLNVDLELLEQGDNGFPAGTRFVFDYDLRRNRSGDGEGGTDIAGATAAGGNGCKRIVWKTRNIANLGGPMQMIQVPECIR